MKRAFLILSGLLVLTLMLGACSASETRSTSAAAAADNYAMGANPEVQMDEGVAVVEESPSKATSSDAPIDPGDISKLGLKIIYTVNLAMEVENAKDTVEKITTEASKVGGYVSDSTFRQEDQYNVATVTVRIPPESLADFTEMLGESGEIKSSNMTSEDVSDQYVDLESRLKNAEAQEEQLLLIMDQAVKIEDILSVRSELNLVQQEIEMLKGQLRYLDNLVGFSTVTITITEPVPTPETPEADPNSGLMPVWSLEFIGSNMQKAFNNSLAVTSMIFGAILMILSFIIVPVLILAAIIVPIVLLVRARRKKKAAKKA